MKYFLLKLFNKNTPQDDYKFLGKRINKEYSHFKSIITLAHTRRHFLYKKNVLDPLFKNYSTKIESCKSVDAKLILMKDLLKRLIYINRNPF